MGVLARMPTPIEPELHHEESEAEPSVKEQPVEDKKEEAPAAEPVQEEKKEEAPKLENLVAAEDDEELKAKHEEIEKIAQMVKQHSTEQEEAVKNVTEAGLAVTLKSQKTIGDWKSKQVEQHDLEPLEIDEDLH